jgi:hypothetical protein
VWGGEDECETPPSKRKGTRLGQRYTAGSIMSENRLKRNFSGNRSDEERRARTAPVGRLRAHAAEAGGSRGAGELTQQQLEAAKEPITVLATSASLAKIRAEQVRGAMQQIAEDSELVQCTVRMDLRIIPSILLAQCTPFHPDRTLGAHGGKGAMQRDSGSTTGLHVAGSIAIFP